MNTLEILKFGGKANENAQAIERAASIITQSRGKGKSLTVVMSAMFEVTDQLNDVIYFAVEHAIAGNGSKNGAHRITTIDTSGTFETDLEAAIASGNYKKVFRFNEERHHEVIDETVDPKIVGSLRLHEMVAERTVEANGHVASMVDLESIDKRWLGWILGMLGEEFMAPIMTARLLSEGIRAVHYNAPEVIVTDRNFGNASPMIEAIRENCWKSGLTSVLQKGAVGVIGGFIGSPDGGYKVTTLGKGGGDRTATALGEAMQPQFDDVSVVLYKADPNLDAIMTGDPKLITNPHVVDRLHYLEACYLGSVGGNILHPKATDHAFEGGFPIWVKTTLNPQFPGTLIDGEIRNEDDPKIKAVSAVRNGIAIRISGRGMDKPGILGRTSSALAENGIDIAFIAQSSRLEVYGAYQYTGREKGSELERKLEIESISTQRILEGALGADLGSKDIASINVSPASMLGVIGRGASRLFHLDDVFSRLGKDLLKHVKSPEDYVMATGSHGVTVLFNFRHHEFIKGVSQAAHDSVIDKVAA